MIVRARKKSTDRLGSGTLGADFSISGITADEIEFAAPVVIVIEAIAQQTFQPHAVRKVWRFLSGRVSDVRWLRNALATPAGGCSDYRYRLPRYHRGRSTKGKEAVEITSVRTSPQN
jgi:hypothetical protein